MTTTGVLAAERDDTAYLSWVGNRPGRLTAAEAAGLRAEHAAARRSGQWAPFAVAVDAHLAAGISQVRLAVALGVSTRHVHDLVSGHLPAGHRRAPVRDWTVGEWITTPVAADLLDTTPAQLRCRLADAYAANITCKAGKNRVWHAPSLLDWWTRTR